MEHDKLFERFLASPSAHKMGFKARRSVTVREQSLDIGEQTKPVYGSLAAVIQEGYKTAIQPNGLPILICPSGNEVAEYDEQLGQFYKSNATYERIVQVQWGCVAPCFKMLLSDSQIDRQLEQCSYGSVAFYTDKRICVEALKQADMQDFRENVAFTNDSLGFEQDENFFNSTLSIPVSAEHLHEEVTFQAIFPPDEEIEKLKALSCEATPPEDNNYDDCEAIGRIIISYRHQEYGRNRICYNDWICACSSIRLVMKANGWKKARFWTDARLRYKYATNRGNSRPWGEMGITPYMLGPVVVLNLSRKASISERFWLTVERKIGATYYGTWLFDDAGDAFFYKTESNTEYSRAIITSVSTSQGILFPQDRVDVLKSEWMMLDVDNVKDAMEVLNEAVTFRAREDFVDEELDEVEIAEKGKTLQWRGDVEALIDPPSLFEIFGCVGNRTDNMNLRIVEISKIVKEMRIVVVVLEVSFDSILEFVAKRLYVDRDGEIRARSVPRLVDEDYVDSLLQFDGSDEVDWRRNPPLWFN